MVRTMKYGHGYGDGTDTGGMANSKIGYRHGGTRIYIYTLLFKGLVLLANKYISKNCLWNVFVK